MILVLIAVALLTVALSAAIVVSAQKRRWGYALTGMCGLVVGGYAAVAALLAGVDGDSADARMSGLGLIAVLVIALIVAAAGARHEPEPNSLWARNHDGSHHAVNRTRSSPAGLGNHPQPGQLKRPS